MSLLEQLTRNGQIWSGQNWQNSQIPAAPSHFAELDAILPGGGWPLGAVTEILYRQPGQGELRLLLPYLGRQSQSAPGWQLWFNPPFRPHGPGLAYWGLNLNRVLVGQCAGADDLLWCLDKALTTGGSQAVLAWVDRLDKAPMRRLQLAAEHNRVAVFLLRPERYRSEASVAALRLHLSAPGPDRLCIDILKRRAGWPVSQLLLNLPKPALIDHD
ncbi:MAG: translesion DNA synthesis-associated protein ImuA [Saccharospirillum sp.]